MSKKIHSIETSQPGGFKRNLPKVGKPLKTVLKITGTRKMWRNLLGTMDIYPEQAFHFDLNTGGGILVRWSPYDVLDHQEYTDGHKSVKHDAGQHIEFFPVKITGRLKNREPRILAVFQYGAKSDDHNWDEVTHWPIPDARQWIRDHLEMNQVPALFWNYNDATLKFTTCKPFTLEN